jgi:hypothetical protein
VVTGLGGGGEGGVAYGFGFGQYNGYYGPAFVFAKSLGTFAK